VADSLIKATLGADDANSYVDGTYAAAYFATRLGAETWTAAATVDQERALITACRNIEVGRVAINRYIADYDPLAPYQIDQALSFPRQKDRDASGAYIIPEPIKQAQCEEALALLSFLTEHQRRRRLQAAGVTSFSVDGLSETYGKPEGASSPLLSLEARQLVAPYLRRGGVIATSDLPAGEFTPGSG
jgi:hypothetical protein